MQRVTRRGWCLAVLLIAGWSAAAMAADADFVALIEASKQTLVGANAPADASQRLEEIAKLATSDAAREASGAVGQAGGPMQGQGLYGIAKPLVQSSAPGRAVYLWPMPAGAGMAAIQGREFTYTLAFQHAVAGNDGAVFLVLYADTDGDGAPDTLIARSPIAQARKAGGWTRWSHTTAEHLIFAGVVFANPAEKAYFVVDPKQNENWNAPDRKVLAAERAGELPRPLPEEQFAVANLQVRIEP